MHNLYLIQVVDKYGPNSFLPLAISYQWLYAQVDSTVQKNYQVIDVLIDKKPITDYVKTMPVPPDVVAISCYIWNWEYNKELAKHIKKLYPTCKIIVGGPQVDKRDTAFFLKYPQFDIAVLGEGECAFREILLKIHNNRELVDIPHTFVKGYGICKLPTRLKDLEAIPSPILTGFYDWIIDKVEAEKGKQMWQVTYETLRGCPYSCTFCDIGDDYWNKITKFELDRIYKEIDWMAEKKIEYVSMCDSNWGMLKRDKDITQYVIKKKQECGYPKVWEATWAKSNSDQVYEIAKMDKDAGTDLFRGVTVSVQTLNDVTEKAIKRTNIKSKKLYSYINLYDSADISTYTELIWPMPGETYDSFKQGIQKIVDMGQKSWIAINALQITFNAEMGQQFYQNEHGMKCRETPLDSYHVTVDDLDQYIVEKTFHVYETATASQDEILRGHVYGYLFVLCYFFGWTFYLMEYMKNKHDIEQIDFIESLLNYFTGTNSLIGNEIKETETLISESLQGKRLWGRQLHDNDMYWDYKGASCIMFYKNKDKLKQELANFVKRVYGISSEEIVRFSLDMCYDYKTKYPLIKSYSIDTLQNSVGIQKTEVVIDHRAKNIDTETDFKNITYIYQRRNRFWKCSIS